MRTELRSRIHTPYTGRLELPPAYRELPLREAGDAFGHARKIAAREGAGTIVWVRRFDTVEFAVVLEPDEPLAAARRVFYLAQCALFDALADTAQAPDERLPDTGVGLALERRLSPAFIRDPVYGTRCSSVVLTEARSLVFAERRFGPDGVAAGASLDVLPRTSPPAAG